MPRNKASKKSGRRLARIEFARKLRERKRQRRERRHAMGVLTIKEKWEEARRQYPGERLMTTKSGDVIPSDNVHEFPLPTVPVAVDSAPTEKEWNEIVATARHRKRSIKSFAQKAGFQLIEGADPKLRESYVRVAVEAVAA